MVRLSFSVRSHLPGLGPCNWSARHPGTPCHSDSTPSGTVPSVLHPKGASRPLGMQMAFGTRPRGALDAARRSPGQGDGPPLNFAVQHHSWFAHRSRRTLRTAQCAPAVVKPSRSARNDAVPLLAPLRHSSGAPPVRSWQHLRRREPIPLPCNTAPGYQRSRHGRVEQITQTEHLRHCLAWAR